MRMCHRRWPIFVDLRSLRHRVRFRSLDTVFVVFDGVGLCTGSASAKLIFIGRRWATALLKFLALRGYRVLLICIRIGEQKLLLVLIEVRRLTLRRFLVWKSVSRVWNCVLGICSSKLTCLAVISDVAWYARRAGVLEISFLIVHDVVVWVCAGCLFVPSMLVYSLWLRISWTHRACAPDWWTVISPEILSLRGWRWHHVNVRRWWRNFPNWWRRSNFARQINSISYRFKLLGCHKVRVNWRLKEKKSQSFVSQISSFRGGSEIAPDSVRCNK